MKLTIDQLKKLVTAIILPPLLAIVFFTSAKTSAATQDDAAATFKAKCAMCHTPKAEKFFDATKEDAALVESVLKGIKPKMPSFEGKLTEDQAKALVAYMKELRK
ncbi:MAG TPA: cytochrome c [Blastocatellia bacterium]|nr:cytochrome c [Blastocatellia bacterium]